MLPEILSTAIRTPIRIRILVRWTIARTAKRLSPTTLASVVVAVLLMSAAAESIAKEDNDAAVAAEKIEFFETYVRPLLVNHCTECHGAELQENGLRLDSREAIIKGGTRGTAIVPGDAEQSLLMHAVRHAEDELAMPPDESLEAESLVALARWINDGAPWPEDDGVALPSTPLERMDELRDEHWAFRAIGRPTPPTTKNNTWAKNDIDKFVLAKLEAAGFEPSPRADRRTLIRRAYFDLIGLPPTYEEAEAFVADESPTAYAELVDRLLARPEYGQRWGRHWLDIARYSDTKGYVRQNDYDPRYAFAWTYRDYVIRALNDDVPYDDFLRQQLAADRLELSEEETWKLAGLGFMNVGRRFFNRRHQILPERVDLVSRGLLGMTMMCAQCHDHKFDPLSAQDYYALYGVLDSSLEPGVPEMPLLGPPLKPDSKRLKLYEAELKEKTLARDKQLSELRDKINDELRGHAADYLVAIADSLSSSNGKPAPELLQPTRGDLRQRPGDNNGGLERWKRLVAAAAPSSTDISASGSSPTANKAAAQSVFRLWHALSAVESDKFAESAPPVIEKAAGSNGLVRAALLKQPPKSMTEAAKTIGQTIEQVHRRWKTLQEVDPGDAGFEDPAAEEIRQWLTADDTLLTIKSDNKARSLYLNKDRSSIQEANDAVEEVVLKYIDVAPPRAMTLVDGDNPHDVAVHLRGDHNRPGKVAPRRFLEVLETAVGESRPATGSSGRLELAEAIVHPDNPLTSRVMVNRIWGWHFGRGLVTTPSDFGTRSTPPSHPELLDYLSRRFMSEGWSMKQMHRLIMTSATYQQAAHDRPACSDVDPLNALLWRMNRRRLEFEPMRDAMLAASGELDTTIGGLPFKDINDRRRSVYFYINRRRIDDTLPTFDVVVPESSLAKRGQSTMPQQALYLMNSGFTLRRARQLVARFDAAPANQSPTDNKTRITQLYRWIYGRNPDAQELAFGDAFLLAKPSGEQPPALSERQKCWQYGFGHFDVTKKQVSSFTPLPHFNGDRWQEGVDSAEMFAQTAYFTADAARAGRDERHTAILRFTPSTGAGLYLFKSQIKPNTNTRIGDGFDIYVATGQGGLQKHFPFKGGPGMEIRAENIELAEGDHIDMIVHARDSNMYDEFAMAPVVWHVERTENGGLKGLSNWQGVDDFERSLPHWVTPLNAWEQYAQVLLISNEFMFVD